MVTDNALQEVEEVSEFSIADRGVSLADQVYRQVAEGLHSGAYSPGDRINIRALAQAMCVSQTPVREAVSRFISEGVLTLENRAIEVPLLARQYVDELFDLRLNLEGLLTEVAVRKLTDVQLIELERIQLEFEAAMERKAYKQVLRGNVAFHFGLYRLAELPLTIRLVERLWLLLGPTMNLAYPALDTAVTGARRHRKVINALRARDEVGARHAVQEDILASKETIARIIAMTPAASKRRATSNGLRD